MVSMRVAGSGWSGFASSFLCGHLDITVSLTFLETHSLTALAGSVVYVLTICRGRTLLHVKGQVWEWDRPGFESQLSHLLWDLS